MSTQILGKHPLSVTIYCLERGGGVHPSVRECVRVYASMNECGKITKIVTGKFQNMS